MLLSQVLDDLSSARELAKDTFANYRRAVIYYGNFLGRDPDLRDLTVKSVNNWLSNEQSTRPASYIRNLRRDLLVVWNFAADNELCEHPKTRLVRMPRVSQPSPQAWPVDWIPRLITAASSLRGQVKSLGCNRNDYATAYVLVAIELLCRPTDMRSLKWSYVKPDGTVTFAQHKTRRIVTTKISQTAYDALIKLKGVNDLFCFPLSKSSTEKLIRKIFREAGIEKPKKQSLGHLRHTGGTSIARVHGNDAARQALGHTPDSRIFERHYLDATPMRVAEAFAWWNETTESNLNHPVAVNS